MNQSHPVANEVRFGVRFAESYRMGFVHHANYFVWFEIGRVELMRQLGFSYLEMEENDGCGIAVIDARCRYKAPARYDDELMVRTHIELLRESIVQFGYELRRVADGELLAEGDTTHIVVDREMKRRTMPEKYAAALRAATEG